MHSTDESCRFPLGATWPGALRLLGLSMLGLWASSACATARPASLQQLRTRAAFDLSCLAHQLQLYHLDQRTKGVIGCGRRLTYVEVCETLHGEPWCSWMLDTAPIGQPYVQHAYNNPILVYGGLPPAGQSPTSRPGYHQPEIDEPPTPEPAPVEPPPTEPEPAAPPAPVSTSRDFGF